MITISDEAAVDLSMPEMIQDLAQAERELTTIAQAIADLYNTPAANAAEHRLQEQTREELETRLDTIRARVLELHLAYSARLHAEVTAELEQCQSELTAAEEELQQAQRRVTAAREQLDQLRGRERTLREQRQNLRTKLTQAAGLLRGNA